MGAQLFLLPPHKWVVFSGWAVGRTPYFSNALAFGLYHITLTRSVSLPKVHSSDGNEV
jgi:hypothetical protein